MQRRSRGLYEALVTAALEAELEALSERLAVRRAELRAADVADRIALHVGRVAAVA